MPRCGAGQDPDNLPTGRQDHMAALAAIYGEVRNDRSITRITVRIGKPDDVDLRLPSLLGQDLLRNWRTIHEPDLQRLEFIPRTADIVGE